ncbi:XVIPCD domain-containing protein [Xanthomonas albilineans]|uniref:XVIPCD domain-containing protein n=1 Tax=Xanthomonas albilineans TaxID=29447 RepID=UPI000AB399AA|nr:XVIPCD domain-containing protein [Xanthomonas albilineans]
MKPADQARADAAIDSYINRQEGDLKNQKSAYLDNKEYQFFGYASDLISGFHATAYRDRKTNEVIIAYRGTDPGLFSGETKAEKAGHALTTIQDIAVDATMVRDAVNPQKAAADAFTAQILAKAAALGIPKDHVTVAGHSLGGALAQIEAAEFGLRGATFNAYGAVSLRHHVPEGGTAVTNYVLAGDPVSAASRHYGTVVTLATPENVQALKDAHYLDVSHGASSPNPLRAMRLGDHSGTHFTGPQSVLSPERLVQFQANYAHNKAAFDHFRQDVHQDRELLNMALNPGATTAMAAKAEALAVQVRAEHAYDAGRQTVERGIHAVEHTAGQAYDTLTHPGQWFQQSAPAASLPPTSTNADTSSSSSSSSAAAASMPPPAMDRHTGLQDDHAFQQRQEHIQQAQQQAVQLAQAYRQTQPPPAHSVPVHEKPASVDMQEQARIAQLQQQEQQAQAAREQQQRLAQQHVQLHRQAMDAQQREHEQRHSQDPRSHQHEQRQAGEAMLYTPPTRPPRSDEHLQDFRHPGHALHSRYTLFKNALEQSCTLPRHGDKLPYGPAQQERLAAGFTDALGINPQYRHNIKGFKQHEGQLLAYDHPGLIYEKSKVVRIDPEHALAKSPEQHAATWRAREATHAPAPPSRVIAPVAITAEDMRHPAHPRHALFEQARDAIADAHERWGRPVPDPEQLDRRAAQVVVETRKLWQTEVDKIYLGMTEGAATQTPNYVVQSHGKLWATVSAPQLTQAPDVAQASQQLQTVDQQNFAEQAMQAQRAAQMQGHGLVMKL